MVWLGNEACIVRWRKLESTRSALVPRNLSLDELCSVDIAPLNTDVCRGLISSNLRSGAISWRRQASLLYSLTGAVFKEAESSYTIFRIRIRSDPYKISL